MNMENDHIEELLSPFREAIGMDFLRYRNHVYRVFHHCKLLDTDIGNEWKYLIAAVFHDIGIWTDHTFDYLGPSIEQMKQYLVRIEKVGSEMEISQMIEWHHKVSSYRGEHAGIVEIFRRADWIDVSFGIRRFGLRRADIRRVKKAFPSHGFHRFLLRQSIRNFFRHPLNPLPMFKA